MIVKKINLLLAFIVFFGFNTVGAQKTAFINETKLLENLPGYKQALQKTDSINQAFVTEIKKEQEAIGKKEQLLLKPYHTNDKITPAEIKAKFSDIDKKKYELLEQEAALLQKKIDAKQDEYSQLYKQHLGVLLNKANTEINNFCKKNKIDVLLKLDKLSSAIAYYDKEKDITDVIVENLKKMY